MQFYLRWWRKERTFNVTKHPINNGITCEAGDGEKETQTCNTQSCVEEDCEGSWSDWSVCSANCDGGTQSRSFTITKPASTGGVQCPASNGETQTRDCNQQSCPVECEGSWSEFGPCISENGCGQGEKSKTYTITRHPINSDECPHADGTITKEICDSGPCPVDCDGSWSGMDTLLQNMWWWNKK